MCAPDGPSASKSNAPDEGAARTKATELADRLLANPVIEQSRLELEALEG